MKFKLKVEGGVFSGDNHPPNKDQQLFQMLLFPDTKFPASDFLIGLFLCLCINISCMNHFNKMRNHFCGSSNVNVCGETTYGGLALAPLSHRTHGWKHMATFALIVCVAFF